MDSGIFKKKFSWHTLGNSPQSVYKNGNVCIHVASYTQGPARHSIMLESVTEHNAGKEETN